MPSSHKTLLRSPARCCQLEQNNSRLENIYINKILFLRENRTHTVDYACVVDRWVVSIVDRAVGKQALPTRFPVCSSGIG